jgi:hypothetical protein
MTFNTLVYLVIVGGVWAFLWWYFARFVIGRRRINSGNRALGLVNFEYLQNADNKKAVQEILFTQEAWEEKSEEGDPPVAGSNAARDAESQQGVERSQT